MSSDQEVADTIENMLFGGLDANSYSTLDADAKSAITTLFLNHYLDREINGTYTYWKWTIERISAEIAQPYSVIFKNIDWDLINGDDEGKVTATSESNGISGAASGTYPFTQPDGATMEETTDEDGNTTSTNLNLTLDQNQSGSGSKGKAKSSQTGRNRSKLAALNAQIKLVRNYEEEFVEEFEPAFLQTL